jgi:hypothetical protein
VDREKFPSSIQRRLKLQTGSFFDSVPDGADGYMMKLILHDWNDEQALTILQALLTAGTKSSIRTFEDEKIIHEILSSSASVKQQEARFMAVTGKSRRTFYLYKRRFGLSRNYHSGKDVIFSAGNSPVKRLGTGGHPRLPRL